MDPSGADAERGRPPEAGPLGGSPGWVSGDIGARFSPQHKGIALLREGLGLRGRRPADACRPGTHALPDRLREQTLHVDRRHATGRAGKTGPRRGREPVLGLHDSCDVPAAHRAEAHLDSHGGFEEDVRDLFTNSAYRVPLGRCLASHIPGRVRPPGTVTSGNSLLTVQTTRSTRVRLGRPTEKRSHSPGTACSTSSTPTAAPSWPCPRLGNLRGTRPGRLMARTSPTPAKAGVGGSTSETQTART